MFKSAWSISAYTVRCCRSSGLEYSRSRNAVDQPSVHGKNALFTAGLRLRAEHHRINEAGSSAVLQ